MLKLQKKKQTFLATIITIPIILSATFFGISKLVEASNVNADTNTYTLSYNPGTTDTVTNMPGSTSCTPASGSSTCNVTLSTQIPNREGYFFLGWGPNPNIDGGWGSSTVSIDGSDDNIAYAEWKKKQTYAWQKGSSSDLIIPNAYYGLYGEVIKLGIKNQLSTSEMGNQCFTIDNSSGNLTVKAQCLNNYDIGAGYTLYFVSTQGTGQGREHNDFANLNIETYSLSYYTGTGRYIKGSEAGLVLQGSGALEKFTSLKIDGETLIQENYTVGPGSTIIDIKPAYLDTLAIGTHTATAVWTDGEGSINFTVAAANDESNDNSDGDNSNATDDTITVPDTGGINSSDNEINTDKLFGLTVITAVTGFSFLTYKRHKKINFDK